MAPHCTFLLLIKCDSKWPIVLERALSPLGVLNTTSEEELNWDIGEKGCDMVIIDATSASDEGLLTARLRSRWPETHVVVVTLSPTWRRAKQVYQAGASDYIYRSGDEKELRASIEAVLASPLPRMSRQTSDMESRPHAAGLEQLQPAS